jgi:hypothetical protein
MITTPNSQEVRAADIQAGTVDLVGNRITLVTTVEDDLGVVLTYVTPSGKTRCSLWGPDDLLTIWTARVAA